MRPFLLSFALLTLGASLAHAQTSMFSVNISLGTIHPQVLVLQQVLNRDPATRIASAGPGSPGQETSYFGLLTRAAVIRFQEKYAADILAPAGLTQGNGYVGAYTRAKLNSLSSLTLSTQPAAMPTPVATPTNPNEEGLDKFFDAIDAVAKEQGLSGSEVATIKSEVRNAIATTTNLREAFFKTVERDALQSAMINSFPGRLFAIIKRTLGEVFMPTHALAQVDPAALDATFQAQMQAQADAIDAAFGVPFGGMLIFPFFCNNSFTWLITIQPLPPTYVTLLSYVPGTQAFLSYNIPFTRYLLGKYIPGGACVFNCPKCVVIPAQGTITPMVGSSPI